MLYKISKNIHSFTSNDLVLPKHLRWVREVWCSLAYLTEIISCSILKDEQPYWQKKGEISLELGMVQSHQLIC